MKIEWTEARVEYLKMAWARGDLARAIADVLGVSRNSVLGKVSRLSLNKRVDLHQPRKVAYQPRGLFVAAKSFPLPEEQPMPHGVPLSEATGCLYPSGTKDYLFCNCPRHEGVWCAEHAKIVFSDKDSRFYYTPDSRPTFDPVESLNDSVQASFEK